MVGQGLFLLSFGARDSQKVPWNVRGSRCRTATCPAMAQCPAFLLHNIAWAWWDTAAGLHDERAVLSAPHLVDLWDRLTWRRFVPLNVPP